MESCQARVRKLSPSSRRPRSETVFLLFEPKGAPVFLSHLLHHCFSLFPFFHLALQSHDFTPLLIQFLICGCVIWNCTLSFLKVKKKKATNESLGGVIQLFFVLPFAGRFCQTLFFSSQPSLLSHTPLFLALPLVCPLMSDNQSSWLRLWRFSSFYHLFVFF